MVQLKQLKDRRTARHEYRILFSFVGFKKPISKIFSMDSTGLYDFVTIPEKDRNILGSRK